MRKSVILGLMLLVISQLWSQSATNEAEIKKQIDQAIANGEDPRVALQRASLWSAEIPLTKPWLKGKLNVNTKFSRISVNGTDQDFVSVYVYDLRAVEKYAPLNLEPNRWVDTKPLIEFTENNNEVTITEKSDKLTGLLISINVPYRFGLKLEANEESIFVFDLEGEIEASSVKGDIKFIRLKGAVVASSEEGYIAGNYLEVSPRYPNMLSSVNGDVQLVIPESASVNIIISIEEGPIESDYRMKTHRNTDKNGQSDIKMVQLGLREASIGITSLYGEVRIIDPSRNN
ncbi:MAG: hypothetical protein HEP71_10600 [Roseivirga sp.]|nr:hypothetical protein [Roseivirga sp.]